MELIFTTISLIIFIMYLYRVFSTLNKYQQDALEMRKTIERIAIKEQINKEK